MTLDVRNAGTATNPNERTHSQIAHPENKVMRMKLTKQMKMTTTMDARK
jgi:hypothetical protein